MDFDRWEYLFRNEHLHSFVEQRLELPADGWEQWGREHGRLISADSDSSDLMVFLINTQDLTPYHVVDFDHKMFGRRPKALSATCAVLGSEIYVTGGLDGVKPEERRTDVYVCDLAQPPYSWSPGPSLLAGMFCPLLFCLTGRIYALEVPDRDSGFKGSFQVLYPSSGWQMLSAPPFSSSGRVRGTACIGDDKIVIHFQEAGEAICDGYYVLACFYQYDVKQNQWSELRKIKFGKEETLEDGIHMLACDAVPYRAYVQDVSLLTVNDGVLALFDFSALGGRDPEEYPLRQILGPNCIDGSLTYWKSSPQWHIYHMGGTKFCVLLTCAPSYSYPTINVFTFDLVHHVEFSVEANSSSSLDSYPDDCNKRRKTDERVGYKIKNFKRSAFVDNECWCYYKSCRRPCPPTRLCFLD